MFAKYTQTQMRDISKSASPYWGKEKLTTELANKHVLSSLGFQMHVKIWCFCRKTKPWDIMIMLRWQERNGLLLLSLYTCYHCGIFSVHFHIQTLKYNYIFSYSQQCMLTTTPISIVTYWIELHLLLEHNIKSWANKLEKWLGLGDTWYSVRGLGFCSQNPCRAAHNHL